MATILLVVHLLIALALVGVVLMQRSEGGGLGIGGGGGGMGGFMTGRDTANLLTRTTAVLAAMFFATSIALAILATQGRESSSVIDAPAGTPVAPPITAPAEPSEPAPPTTDD